MPDARLQAASQQASVPNWEGRFREMLENVRLIAIMLDVTGNLTFCNSCLLELTGWEREDIVGGNWFDLFVPSSEREKIFKLFTESFDSRSFPAHHESAIVIRSGNCRMIRWNNTPLRDPDGRVTGWASIGEDITDTLLLEEQYRQAQKLESVGRLAGGIAHDFNNLLTVINGYADLMLSSDSDPELLHDSATEIRKAGERATSLTRQLLAFSRNQPANLRTIDLNEVIADQANMLRRLVGEDVELSIVPAPGVASVRADPSQVHQVVMNLAVNARDAMPQGGRLTIVISLADSMDPSARLMFPEAGAGPCVVLTVSDTGSGMSDEVRAQAFDPFFTTKPAGQGTGLGLSTVYGIVRQLGGWLTLQSQLGAGTTFRLGFPRLETSGADESAGSETEVAGGHETILLVEDEDEVRRFAAGVLQRYGYRVLEAASPGDAILIAEQTKGPIHLILSDIVMPRINGRDLVRRLAPLRPEMRVLYMSGYPGDAVAPLKGSDPGVCIAKPFTAERLAQTVRAVLGAPADLPRVLIADDEESIRRLFTKVLEAQGYRVTAAVNGSQALALIASGQQNFALAIIDLVMPEGEGIETIRSLRKEHPDMKIIAVSGAFKTPVLRSMLTCASMLGADATLTKPISPEDLVAAVRTLLS